MKTTFIFDFDYTLADSSRGVYECTNYALKAMGEASCGWEECCVMIGQPLNEIYNSLTGKLDAEREAEFYRLFTERADQVMAANTELFPGVPVLVDYLGRRGVTAGILSTKFGYRIRQILAPHGLADKFSPIIGGEDVGKLKPDPEGLRLFLSKTSASPEQAIMVGDSLTDAETALRGRVDFVAVLSGKTVAGQFKNYSPLAILDSVDDIPEFYETIVR